MSHHDAVVELLDRILQRGDAAPALTATTALLGEMPEFDSMTVVTVLEALEDRFDMVVDDDELNAETFTTVGSLVAFVDRTAGDR